MFFVKIPARYGQAPHMLSFSDRLRKRFLDPLFVKVQLCLHVGPDGTMPIGLSEQEDPVSMSPRHCFSCEECWRR